MESIENSSSLNVTAQGAAVQSFFTRTVVSTPVLAGVVSVEKPELFNGTKFKWWFQNMFFYLTTLIKFIKETGPVMNKEHNDHQAGDYC